MSIRLTRKRLEALHVQLSFDDVLYEKFRRLNEDLNRRERRLARKGNVAKVLQQREKGIMLALQIQDVHVTEEGTVVIVR